MSQGTGFRVHRFSQLPLDEAWLSRTCRTIWDQVSGRPHGVSVVDAPDGGALVFKAGRARFLRESRSNHAARMAQCLRAAGVLTPKVHAVCAQSPGGLNVAVMERVQAIDMKELLLSDAAGDWIGAMATSIAGMHAAGVRHRDLKGSNILLAMGDAGPAAWLIDLDGARQVRFGVRLAKRARDLARLDLSLDLMGASGPDLLRSYAHLVGWSPREQGRARSIMDAYKVAKCA